jgi:hypothetical protein
VTALTLIAITGKEWSMQRLVLLLAIMAVTLVLASGVALAVTRSAPMVRTP